MTTKRMLHKRAYDRDEFRLFQFDLPTSIEDKVARNTVLDVEIPTSVASVFDWDLEMVTREIKRGSY